MQFKFANLCFLGAAACVGAWAAHLLTKYHYEELISGYFVEEGDGVADQWEEFKNPEVEEILGKRFSDGELTEYEAQIAEEYRNPVFEEEMGEDGDENIAILTPIRMDELPSSLDLDIYSIQCEEFGSHEDEYDTSTLYYYAQDETFCDEDNDIITNPEELISEIGVTDVKGHDDTLPNLYFRNDITKDEYEVIFIDQSYAEEILGYGMAEEEKMMRQEVEEE